MKIETSCATCGKLILKRKDQILNFQHHFCNTRCHSEYKKTGRMVSCGTCDKEIWATNSRINKSKTRKVYCNHSCASKSNNVGVCRNKTSERLKYGPKTYRRRAIKYYGADCQKKDCPIRANGIEIPEKLLDVDHIDSDRNNNLLSNLQVLCVWCHMVKTRIEENYGK